MTLSTKASRHVRGFTIIELCGVGMVLIVFAAVVTNFLHQHRESAAVQDHYSRTLIGLRQATQRLRQDLTTARAVECGASRLTIHVGAARITYELQKGHLIRLTTGAAVQAPNRELVATGLRGFACTRRGALLEIQLRPRTLRRRAASHPPAAAAPAPTDPVLLTRIRLPMLEAKPG